MTGLVCWRCGASLKDIPKPLGRLAQRLCKFYNPNHFEKCDHDMAEPAREVDVANFCHYFRPRADAYNPQEKSRADDAMAELKALFGESEMTEQDENKETEDKTETDSDKAKFDSLFKKD